MNDTDPTPEQPLSPLTKAALRLISQLIESGTAPAEASHHLLAITAEVTEHGSALQVAIHFARIRERCDHEYQMIQRTLEIGGALVQAREHIEARAQILLRSRDQADDWLRQIGGFYTPLPLSPLAPTIGGIQ